MATTSSAAVPRAAAATAVPLAMPAAALRPAPVSAVPAAGLSTTTTNSSGTTPAAGSSAPLEVRHSAAAPGGEGAFTVTMGADEARLEYTLTGAVMDAHHTIVPPAFRGKGVAQVLCDAMMVHARAQGLKVKASCSYLADTYFVKAGKHNADLRV